MSAIRINLDQACFLSSMPKDDDSFFQIKLMQGEYSLDAQLELFNKSELLIVAFHGNVNQRKNPYPVFQKRNLAKRFCANILSMADPTLQKDGSMNLGWYLGFHDFLAQKVMVDFFSQVIKSYGFKRVIFMGGSGGGFAALFCSWHFPSSFALVSNPQTVLVGDRLPRQSKLAKISSSNFENNIDHQCLDVCALYKSGFENKVIYLQNGECTDDLRFHAGPFLHSCMGSNSDNLIIKIDYWGVKGHSGSVPFAEILKWVNTINSLGGDVSSPKIFQKYFDLAQSSNDDLQRFDGPKSQDRLFEVSEILGSIDA